jgi:hypothetical protein
MDVVLMLDAMRLARFWARVDRRGSVECWNWLGAVTANGYGRFSPRFGGRSGKMRRQMAHRVAYEAIRGAVPDGLVLDHLCRNRRCVNPLHLEPVTQAENVMRGVGVGAVNAAKDHCTDGHEFSAVNTYITPNGRRQCRECAKRRSREYYERKALGRA